MSRSRMAMFNLHKSIGFVFALYFAAIFFSGTLLVFQQDADALVHPASLSGTSTTPPDQVFPAYYDALVNNGDFRSVSRLVRPASALGGDFAIARTQENKARKVWIDPDDFSVEASRPEPGFFNYVRMFHESLFVPLKLMHLAVTGTSFILLAMVVFGLVSYRRFWRGLFRKPSREATLRIQRGGWHRLLGVWTAPFLLAIAVTGSVFFLVSLGVLTEGKIGQNVRFNDVPQVSISGEDLSRAIEAALVATPGLEIEEVFIPGLKGEVFGITGRDGASGYFNRMRISINPVDYTVLKISSEDEFPLKTKLIGLSEMIHYGHWGGQISQFLWLIFGLAATGLVMFGALTRLAHSGTKDRFWKAMFRELKAFGYLYVVALVLVCAAFVVRFVI